MRLFAFMWTVLFILSVPTAMWLDKQRHLIRLWKEVTRSLTELEEKYILLGLTAAGATSSIKTFIDICRPKFGELYYSDDTNEVFVWDGRMWERVRDY